MNVEFTMIKRTASCHCTAEENCQEPAIACLQVSSPTDGAMQAMRYFCERHLEKLTFQANEARRKSGLSV